MQYPKVCISGSMSGQCWDIYGGSTPRARARQSRAKCEIGFSASQPGRSDQLGGEMKFSECFQIETGAQPQHTSTRWANDLIFWVSRTFQTCGPAFLGSQVTDHGARNSFGSELMCLFADWPPLNVTTCNLIVVIILQIKYVLRWPRCQGGAALCRGLN